MLIFRPFDRRRRAFQHLASRVAFALSSVQEELFVSFGFALRLNPLSLSLVAMFSQTLFSQTIGNNSCFKASSAHTAAKHFGY